MLIAIQGADIENRYKVDMFEADYNQAEYQVLDFTSELYNHNADYTIIFQSTHKLLEKYSMMLSKQWDTLADDRFSCINTICKKIKGKIIYYNYPEIEDSIFGNIFMISTETVIINDVLPDNCIVPDKSPDFFYQKLRT